MRLVASLLLLIAACETSVDPDDYPIEPGGGGGSFGSSGGTLPDAAGGGDGGTTLSGRVCGITEILALDDCAPTGLAGLEVTLGTSPAVTTSDSGAFDIDAPSGSNLVWRASGGAQLASLLEYSTVHQIPSISNDLYEQLTADANIVIENGAGAIFATVIYAGSPVAGATATLAGLQDFVRYDDSAATGDFSLDATNTAGIIWFPNVTPGTTVTFTVTPPALVGAPMDTTVIVEPNTVTFATVVFP